MILFFRNSNTTLVNYIFENPEIIDLQDIDLIPIRSLAYSKSRHISRLLEESKRFANSRRNSLTDKIHLNINRRTRE